MSGFYSGNPMQPAVYNPAYNIPTTSDLNTLQPIETSIVYGQSIPGGNRQINSIIVPKLVGDSLMVHGPGPTYIYGPIDNQLQLPQGALFGDGSPSKPSIAFASDPDTGLYHPAPGSTGFTSDGSPVVAIGPSLDVSVPITTPGGQNLVLRPSGPSVDFQGRSIINVGGGGGGSLSAKFELTSQQIIVDSVTEVPIAYLPWNIATWASVVTRTFYIWVQSSPTLSFTMRVRNNGGAILGSTTVAAGAFVGMVSFTISAPVANTKLDFIVLRQAGAGTFPRIYGVFFEGV